MSPQQISKLHDLHAAGFMVTLTKTLAPPFAVSEYLTEQAKMPLRFEDVPAVELLGYPSNCVRVYADVTQQLMADVQPHLDSDLVRFALEKITTPFPPLQRHILASGHGQPVSVLLNAMLSFRAMDDADIDSAKRMPGYPNDILADLCRLTTKKASTMAVLTFLIPFLTLVRDGHSPQNALDRLPV